MALNLMIPFGVPLNGVIHVGANRGQEIKEYMAEVDRAILIEPIPRLVTQLKETLAQEGAPFQVFEACCSDTTGTAITFNVSGGGADSSSMFELGRLGELYPSISYVEQINLTTVTLDDLLDAEGVDSTAYNVLVIDTQGADLKVLQGATKLLDTIDFIYVEVSIVPLYENSCTLRDIVAFLEPFGFSMRHLNVNIMDWGNALFTRDTLNFLEDCKTSIATHGKASQSSTHGNNDNDFGAANAVNGKFTQVVGSRTKLQDKAHWELDLGAVTPVRQALWLDRRRRQSSPHPIDVKISNDGETFETIMTLDTAEKRSSATLVSTIDIDRETRFIRLQAQGRHSLAISQFYVFSS